MITLQQSLTTLQTEVYLKGNWAVDRGHLTKAGVWQESVLVSWQTRNYPNSLDYVGFTHTKYLSVCVTTADPGVMGKKCISEAVFNPGLFLVSSGKPCHTPSALVPLLSCLLYAHSHTSAAGIRLDGSEDQGRV